MSPDPRRHGENRHVVNWSTQRQCCSQFSVGRRATSLTNMPSSA